MSTILHIENEPAVRNLIRRVLESEGYVIISKNSLAEAELAISLERPDLTIVDGTLQKRGDGLAWARANKDLLNILVLHGGNYSEEELRDLPPNVQKPITADTLRDITRSLLNVKRRANSSS